MTQIVGKTALITGGASGIGYLMGKSLLAAGAKAVVIWDIQDVLMAGVAKEFTAQGHEAITFRVDLSDAEQIRRAASEMQQRGIAIDILVNNAGIVVGKTFADHSHQEIARTMGIN